MADPFHEVLSASTKEEYEAFQQFLIDNAVLSPPETAPSAKVALHPIMTVERVGEEWKSQAACKDLPKNLFFEEGRDKNEEKVALRQKVCGSCAVRLTCIEYALQFNEKFGVWGGYDFNIAKEKAEARKFVKIPAKRRLKSA